MAREVVLKPYIVHLAKTWDGRDPLIKEGGRLQLRTYANEDIASFRVRHAKHETLPYQFNIFDEGQEEEGLWGVRLECNEYEAGDFDVLDAWARTIAPLVHEPDSTLTFTAF